MYLDDIYLQMIFNIFWYLWLCIWGGYDGVPDGSRHVAVVPPLFGRVDVHAPQLPVVAVARVLVALHLKGVVFDVVDGRQDDPLMVFFYSGQYRLSPDTNTHT